MTEAEFTAHLGRKPTYDELTRVNCDQPGVIGHTLCGWCAKHDTARTVCRCPAPRVVR